MNLLFGFCFIRLLFLSFWGLESFGSREIWLRCSLQRFFLFRTWILSFLMFRTWWLCFRMFNRYVYIFKLWIRALRFNYTNFQIFITIYFRSFNITIRFYFCRLFTLSGLNFLLWCLALLRFIFFGSPIFATVFHLMFLFNLS